MDQRQQRRGIVTLLQWMEIGELNARAKPKGKEEEEDARSRPLPLPLPFSILKSHFSRKQQIMEIIIKSRVATWWMDVSELWPMNDFPFFPSFLNTKTKRKDKRVAVRCCSLLLFVLWRDVSTAVWAGHGHAGALRTAPHCTAPHRKSCRWLAQRVGPTSSSSALVFLFFFFSFLFFSSLVDDDDDDDGHPLTVDSTRFSLLLLLLLLFFLFCFCWASITQQLET